jgi:hypothetical protein
MKNSTSTRLHNCGELLNAIGQCLIFLWFLVWTWILFKSSVEAYSEHVFHINLLLIVGIISVIVGFFVADIFPIRHSPSDHHYTDPDLAAEREADLRQLEMIGNSYEPRERPCPKPPVHNFTDRTCPDCNGTGRCKYCRGTGKLGWSGLVHTTELKCSQCYGEGVCRTCGGTGLRKW